MTEPVVWVPRQIGTIISATAAADPELEPPGVYSILFGFAVGPGARWPNSVVTVFPRVIQP